MWILRSLLAVVLITGQTLGQNIKNKNVHCEELMHNGYIRIKNGNKAVYKCVIKNYLLSNDREYYLDRGEDINNLTIVQATVEDLPSSLFANLKYLDTLIIRNSKYEYVDKLEFPLVTTLDFSSNEIKSLDEEAFLDCPRSKHISLSNNEITALSGTPFYGLNLTDIDLSHNKIRSISDSVFNTTQYKKLNISYNYLEEIEIGIFQNITGPGFLDLSFNKLKVFHSSDTVFETKLSFLNLTSNELTSLNVSNLEILYLNASDNKIENLSLGRGIREIYAENNQICNISINSKKPILKILNMRNNNLENNLGDICKCEYLKLLWLDSNNIDDIGSCFSRMRTLEEVTLAKNNIFQLNFESFHTENKIKTLDLSFNRLEIIDEYTMSFFTKLERLYLNGNSIYDFYISPRLFMPNLQIVGLSHNKLKCSKLFLILKNFIREDLQIHVDRTLPVNTTNIDGIACYRYHELELLKNTNNLDEILELKTNEKLTLFWQKINKMEEKLNHGISLIEKLTENIEEINSKRILELENVEKGIQSKPTE